MADTENTESLETQGKSVVEKLGLQNSRACARTLIIAILGVLIYFLIEVLPQPYVSIGLFKVGFIPAVAIVALIGAIRGPLAGFLAGYLGSILTDLLLNGYLVANSLYGVALGALGIVVGLVSYDFANGRSLAKLSIMSLIGLVFTILLSAVVGLRVEGVAILVVIGTQLLHLVTLGIPTVILLTPLFARFWKFLETSAVPFLLEKASG